MAETAIQPGPFRNRLLADERILSELKERLAGEPALEESELRIDVTGGEVTLSGKVVSKRMKRDAEELAGEVNGVTRVINNIRIERVKDPQRERSF